MMFGIGIVLLLLGISLSGLTAIGVVTAGVSVLPLAIWATMLITSVVASFAGLFLSIKN